MLSSAPTPAAGSVVQHRLYTEDQRVRRDATIWTLVQGVLAPIQFLIFLISVSLVIHYLLTGDWYAAATASVIVKTLALYLIMITGAIWEKVVFGQFLFAPAFFWEDVFSFAVISLHTLYLYGLFSGAFAPTTLMYIALAAYLTYVINAGQFLWKLRLARLDYARQTAAQTRAPVTAQVAA
jgi:3-vinyl bacteriochlorophyllide hydratase